jgi:drug/metabolite transporter (DMT)-like permease
MFVAASSDDGASRVRLLAWIALLVTFWGVSWPVYKWGLRASPPILFAGIRTLLGGILLTGLALAQRRRFRWRTHWRTYLLSTLLNSALFFGIQTVSIDFLPSGLSSVVVYFEPVLVGLLAWLWLGEPFTPAKAAGLALGFLGVVSVSAESLSGRVSWLGIVLGLAAALSWALGTVYLKRVQRQVDLLCLVAVQCLLGGSALTAFGSLVESLRAVQWQAPEFIGGVLFGGFIGTSTSWLIWFYLVRQGEVTRMSAYTFLVPLISVIIGTLWLKEPLTPYLFVGMILIALSIYLVNRPTQPAALREK